MYRKAMTIAAHTNLVFFWAFEQTLLRERKLKKQQLLIWGKGVKWCDH